MVLETRSLPLKTLRSIDFLELKFDVKLDFQLNHNCPLIHLIESKNH